MTVALGGWEQEMAILVLKTDQVAGRKRYVS